MKAFVKDNLIYFLGAKNTALKDKLLLRKYFCLNILKKKEFLSQNLFRS
jgi:hypothetical protein